MSADDKKPFETASATTDPDNSNSGPFAYIITGVCVGALLLFGVLCSSCASIAISAAASTAASPSGAYGGYDDTPYPDDFGLEDLEDLFDYYDEQGNRVKTEIFGSPVYVVSEERLAVEDKPLGECDIIFGGVLTDVYQRTMTTEKIEAHAPATN